MPFQNTGISLEGALGHRVLFIAFVIWWVQYT